MTTKMPTLHDMTLYKDAAAEWLKKSSFFLLTIIPWTAGFLVGTIVFLSRGVWFVVLMIVGATLAGYAVGKKDIE